MAAAYGFALLAETALGQPVTASKPATQTLLECLERLSLATKTRFVDRSGRVATLPCSTSQGLTMTL
ncbi:MAG TPA: hypothetical protein VF132_04280, partial [Rudaea sp.]